MAIKLRFFSAEDVRKSLSMPQAIAAMREAFSLLSQGEVVVPLRLHLDIPEYEGVQLVKPVYVPALKQSGFKVISLFRNNHQLGLPLSHAVMMVFDAVTGIPQAMMDGDSLTALRTGATAGLATDLLANRNARVMAIFGAGLQARTQIEAVRMIRPLQKILIADPNLAKARKLAEELQSLYKLQVEILQKPDQLREAQIISTVTTSDTPVFSDKDLSEGVHINAMGAFKPASRETPSETIHRAKVVVDQREACLKEAGDLLIPINQGMISPEHIRAEIGEIILGKRTARENEQEITLFKSVGNAVQDLLAARVVLINSQQQNLGMEFSL